MCRICCTAFGRKDRAFVICIAVDSGDVNEGAGVEGLDGVVGDEIVIKRWIVGKERFYNSVGEFGIDVVLLESRDGESAEAGEGVFLAGVLFCAIGSGY